MKKALIVASVASMIDQFIIPSIKLLQSMGYEVDVATNFEKGSTCTTEKISELKNKLYDMGVDAFQIDFDRKITNLKGIVTAIKQLNEVVKGIRLPIRNERKHEIREYSFIHCHSPIGGVVARLVARKNNIKSIYTAHGFHFYKSAPIKNWLIFYPVEWLFSWITDVLITINREDYLRSKKHLHAKNIFYMPGVGIDISRFDFKNSIREQKREELGFSHDDIVILSVGELNDNKNHRIIIDALGNLVFSNSTIYNHIHYVIAGKGELLEDLQKLAELKGIQKQIHLLGFRTDVAELLQAADIFALPSKREGLNVSLMEAIVSGKYCLASDIRGNQDLIIDGQIGALIESSDLNGWRNAISIVKNQSYNMSDTKRKEIVEIISSENINNCLRKIYENI